MGGRPTRSSGTLGGTRAGSWASESFTSERAAIRFGLDVEDAGKQWPDGWVKGHGFVTEDDAPPTPTLRPVADDYARLLAERGRTTRAATVPDALPPVNGSATTMGTCKLSDRLLAFVRAKAEMEQRTVTDVVSEALEAYITAPPGARATWTMRGR